MIVHVGMCRRILRIVDRVSIKSGLEYKYNTDGRMLWYPTPTVAGVFHIQQYTELSFYTHHYSAVQGILNLFSAGFQVLSLNISQILSECGNIF